MNLIDSFEPMQIPTDGFAKVRHNARNRAIKRKLVTGGAVLALPICMAVGFGQHLSTNDFDNGSDYEPPPTIVTTAPTLPPATSPPSTTQSTPTPITPGNAQITVKPDPAGLPGSSVGVDIIKGLLFYASAFAYIVMLMIVVTSLVGSIRGENLFLRFTRVERVVIAIGLILPVCLIVLDWFFGI